MPVRRLREFRNERIVGRGDRKSRRPQFGAQHIVAAAIVEHAQRRFVCAEHVLHGGRIVARPRLHVLRIDRQIARRYRCAS